MLARIVWMGLALAALALAPRVALGQAVPGSAAAAPDPPEVGRALDSPEAVREMVSRLSDEEVRALLLRRLDAEASEEPRTNPLLALGESVEDAGVGFAEAVGLAVDLAPNLAGGWAEALGRFHVQRDLEGTLWVLGVLALALAVSWAARRLVRAALGPARARTRLGEEASLGQETLALLARAGIDAAAVAAFLGAFYLAINLLLLPSPPEPRPSDYLVLWFLWKGPILAIVVMSAVTRLLLAPGEPEMRLIHMDDATARFLQRSLVVFAGIAGFRGYLLSFLGGHGVDLAALQFGFWMNLLLYGWLLFVIARARHGLTQSLIGEVGEPTSGERAVAEAYPWLAMGLVVLVWALTVIFSGLGLFNLLDGRMPLTLLILMFAPAADRVVRALVYRVAPPEEGEGEIAERAFRETRRSYVRVGRVIIAFAVIFVLTRIWNFRIVDMAGMGIGAQLAGRLIEAGLILGIGYILTEIVRIRINGMLAREKAPAVDAEEPGGGEGGGVGGSRLATVLPLVSLALQGAILTVTVLTALGSLGIDTTPLLAGAGIVGLAIGFGAQTLVGDIVSGIFFLIDDAFRTGEYVEVEGTFGTVEAISIRSLRLRHHEGPVHTIPFGQIPKLTNYSRDWVIMKLRFTVPFNTDLMKVKRLFKQIGKDMAADPAFADDFLQPFKSQGVLEVNDVGMVVRGKFMAKPGRQWTLRKEIYARVQQAFEEAGIQFARKEVRVKIDAGEGGTVDPAQLTEAQKRAVGAAAHEAAEEAEAVEAGPEPR